MRSGLEALVASSGAVVSGGQRECTTLFYGPARSEA